MTRFELIKEIIGCLCFGLLLFMILVGLYVISPAQPSMHSESSYAEGEQ